eukprot:TRINITY_DN7528_c0_g2_i3.p1 TRINITY_DN7528_c0_g2~~TRINITY_DN7528_c0_g2_i3.p1  ORF type:complete len:139 (+),score=6.11 TRINITY_DN7528_c0_g2_i3:157-573(+)
MDGIAFKEYIDTLVQVLHNKYVIGAFLHALVSGVPEIRRSVQWTDLLARQHIFFFQIKVCSRLEGPCSFGTIIVNLLIQELLPADLNQFKPSPFEAKTVKRNFPFPSNIEMNIGNSIPTVEGSEKLFKNYCRKKQKFF